MVSLRRMAAAVLAIVMASALLCAARSAARADQERGRAASTLRLFFAPSDGDLTADLEAAAKLLKARPEVRFRASFLASDLAAVASPDGAFAATVKELRRIQSLSSPGLDPGLRILDEEALAAARRLGVEATPAWVFVDASGTAHVALGRGANLGGLLSCK